MSTGPSSGKSIFSEQYDCIRDATAGSADEEGPLQSLYEDGRTYLTRVRTVPGPGPWSISRESTSEASRPSTRRSQSTSTEASQSSPAPTARENPTSSTHSNSHSANSAHENSEAEASQT